MPDTVLDEELHLDATKPISVNPSAAAATDCCVVVLTGECIGRTYRLARSTTVIGRAPTADIPLTDESVAWHHASVKRDGGAYVLNHLDGASETYVNGTAVNERSLMHGDRVQLGMGPILKFTELSDLRIAKAPMSDAPHDTDEPLTSGFAVKNPE